MSEANIVLLMYNTHAGYGSFKDELDRVINRFQQKNMLILPYKVSNHEAMVKMLNTLNKEKIKKAIIVGGDGTVNICLNALFTAEYDIPVAIFPAGTANDFAHHFDLPHDMEGLIRISLKDHYTYADVGMINDKYFINVASMGFLIDVSQRTDPQLKTSLGVLSYYLKGIGELPNMRAIPIKITSKELTIEEEIFFMLVMNGSSAGGFKKIAPGASVNDGKFDVIVFKKCPVIDIMSLVIGVLKGDHILSPYVEFFQTDELLIECDMKVGTDMDGEKGPEFPIHIKNLHNKIKVNTKSKNLA